MSEYQDSEGGGNDTLEISTKLSMSIKSSGTSLPTQQTLTFHELNFFPLPNQSNIYGFVNIQINGHNKLLVATVRGEIYRLEFDPKTLQASYKLITFSYIPGANTLMSKIHIPFH